MKRHRLGAKSKSSSVADQEADYARRLCHQCRTSLHRQAKQVKQLSCQRVASQLKKQHPDKRQNLEQRLLGLKQLALQHVVEEALRRLGVPQMEAEGTTMPIVSPPDEESKGLIETLLSHKRMQDALEKWSAEMRTYRRWCLEQEEKAMAREAGARKRGAKRKRPSNPQNVSRKDDAYDYSQSVFLKLGGGEDDEDDDDEEGEKDQDGDHHHEASSRTKKNRPGQRARHAKAMAIQAKKEGRMRDPSLNWRRPRKDEEGTRRPPKPTDHAAVASSRTTGQGNHPDKEEESLHPSWAARKEQKTGISEFQGKRITF